MPQLLSGAGITIKLFGLTLIGSIPLGIILAFILASRLRILKAIVQSVCLADARNAFTVTTDLCVLWSADPEHCL